MEWQELENRVRLIASYLWDCAAEPETINGVKIDCVCKLRPDYWVIVEITTEKTLDKLRTDLAKFAVLRPYLFSQSTYPECYFVCDSKPPRSLVETGRGQNVTVLSLESFQRRLFDFSKYSYGRGSQPFGSAIDPSSGKKDDIQYVPVGYAGTEHNRKYFIEDLARLLMRSNRIILIGGYGTGKSRCVQELFAYFERTMAQMSSFPIAINLRDHWGTRRGYEIIRRHFDEFGLGGHSDNVVKVMPRGGIILLLDGFDEIASQAWSDDPTRLKDIRAKSLLGVKDLISQNKGGLLVTGREQYFNSDKEMFQSLGLNPESTIFVRCPDEFTDEEMARYLKNVSRDLTLPQWLPRRPLICKTIADIEPETLTVIMGEPAGEAHFWQLFIKVICEREARINPSLDAVTVENVLCEVASRTRVKMGDVGPVSTVEINQAFEKVVGLRPSDESAIILQRLPTLGRVASESPDRQFVDEYVLDGLRAEHLISCVYTKAQAPLDEVWINPLRRFGITLVANSMESDGDVGYRAYMHRAASGRNQVLAGDILAALSVCSDRLELDDLVIHDGHISFLDLSDKEVSHLSIFSTIIDEIDIAGVQARELEIRNCVIRNIYGVSGARGLPQWMSQNDVEHFQEIGTTSRIRSSALSKAQQIFLTITKKTFFQPGSGRKEEALLRGLGAQADSRLAGKIINLLLHEGVLKRVKGKEGYVYIPNRAYSRRMVDIRAQLTTSSDSLWKQLDEL